MTGNMAVGISGRIRNQGLERKRTKWTVSIFDFITAMNKYLWSTNEK